MPNDAQLFDTTAGSPGLITAIENFANFQRLLNQPTPVARSTDMPRRLRSTRAAGQKFNEVGCALCHTPSLTYRASRHRGGAEQQEPRTCTPTCFCTIWDPGLADDIVQGGGRGDEFRTAPLWGLGQRIFFLHDGRTSDLVEAIRAHRSSGNSKFGPSEANAVIERFYNLGGSEQQDILNFLRSL